MKPYYEHGGITIYHGDCRDVLPTVHGVTAIVSDPPYGMSNNCDYTRFTGGHRTHEKGASRKYDPIVGDNEPFDPSWLLSFNKVLLWGFHHFAHALPVGTVLVWIKRLDGAFGSFLSDAELAWSKGGCGVYCRRDTSIFAEATTRIHPTQKPVPLMRWCIERSRLSVDDLVADPYMGSGTTLLAAKELGLNAVGIEIEEKWCESAAKRLSQEVFDFSPKAAP